MLVTRKVVAKTWAGDATHSAVTVVMTGRDTPGRHGRMMADWRSATPVNASITAKTVQSIREKAEQLTARRESFVTRGPRAVSPTARSMAR